MTVNSYIRNRRLSLAGNELYEGNCKISDIAYKYGYDTPESFTKAFSRFHGIAPKYVKEKQAKLILFNPLSIKVIMEGGKEMEYKIVTKQKQKFLALKRDFNNEIINDKDNNDIPLFYQECIDNKLMDKLLALKESNHKDIYGLCLPSKTGETTFKYGIAILLDEHTLNFDLLEMEKLGFSMWEVNEETYVVFDCIGNDASCISLTWEKFYKEFLPQTGYVAKQVTDLEFYPENEKQGVFCQVYIPIESK